MSTSLQNRYRPMPPSARPIGEVESADDALLHANSTGTILAVAGIIITWLTLGGKTPSEVAHHAAVGVGISLLISFGYDLRAGIRNMIRADVMAIAAFYFLTLFEFIFPQPRFNTLIAIASTEAALNACFMAYLGLLVGRHCIRLQKPPFERVLSTEIPPILLVLLFWAAFFVGFLHQLLAVNFNVIEWVNWFLEPRFTQPWGRGKFGDWKALVHELGLFIYLLPPMAGIMIARRKRYPWLLLATVVFGFFFILFYAFTGGTRSVFASYLVTFLIAYALARPPKANPIDLVVVSGTAVAMMIAATMMMLSFRNDGIREWLKNGPRPDSMEAREGGFVVDYNLFAMARLCEVFPAHAHYLGWEVPYLAVIRPIPRALWKNKPEGMSTSIEDAMGVQGLTIATSFAGEAYMAAGLFGVLAAGLMFGALNGWWSSFSAARNSELGILVYSSGFFAAVISMRSMFEYTTALLPVMASFVLTAYVVAQILKRKPKADPNRQEQPPSPAGQAGRLTSSRGR